jgi:hypothetical protein
MNDDYVDIWIKFRQKYKNCWLMCGENSTEGNGNLGWLMDKFVREDTKKEAIK